MKNKNKGRNTAAAAPAAEPDNTEVEESEESEPTPTDTEEEAPKKPTKEEIKARIARYTDSLGAIVTAQEGVTEAEAATELILKEIHDTSGPGLYKVDGKILHLSARKISKGANAGKMSYKLVEREEENIIG